MAAQNPHKKGARATWAEIDDALEYGDCNGCRGPTLSNGLAHGRPGGDSLSSLPIGRQQARTAEPARRECRRASLP